MTERRPHWDDDLLNEVMGLCYDIEQCHAVIAAVEDWQAEKRKGAAAFMWLMARDAHQRSVIERVRELCSPADACPCGKCATLIDARDILRVIDGSAMMGGTQ